MSAPWLKRVLRDLEAAIMILVDVEAGRAPLGGDTFDEQRRRAQVDAQAKIKAAAHHYERHAATLTRALRRRAACLFGAAFLLERRTWRASGLGPDTDLASFIRRFEEVIN